MIKKYFLALLFSLSLFGSGFGQTCDTPTGATVFSITESSATFSWIALMDENQWEVLLLPFEAPEPIVTDSGFPTTVNLFTGTGLSPCTAYKFYVRSVCAPMNISSWSQALHFTTNAPAGGCPPNANDDNITIYPNNSEITVSTISVLANDTVFGGLPASGHTYIMPVSVPSGFSLNPDGTISVLPGTASGTYTLSYTICLMLDNSLCDFATVTVNVSNGGLLLNAFVDSNSNGTQDSSEQNFNLGQFHYELNNNGNIYHVSSADGTYLINETGMSNSYDLSFTIDPAYSAHYSLTTSSYNDVTYSGSGVQIYNFPVTQLPYSDLAVLIVPSGAPPRPGFTYTNQIRYSNNGNQPIASGTLTFNRDNAVTITNVSQAGTTPAGTGFTYDFVNLLPGEIRTIYVTMQVPTIPTVALGDVITNSAAITIPSGDINVSNNTNSLLQVIVGSYDPNDKTESHGDKIVHSTFTSADYLMYTIQFENTGTYQAENVRITDLLDIKLDETSVKMVDASHPYKLTAIGNNLTWNLNGIDLPPSGKGHVTFQVKPESGYAIGDIIPNTASIYFDFNPAIVTNTFSTEFVMTMGISEFSNDTFSAYPNPSNGRVTLSSKNNTLINSVTINDISGKTVQQSTISSATAILDLSHLSNGIYFLKAKSDTGEKTIKLIKN